ncbi:hypothetical protein C2E23DRAFT_744038 [Lenzites betulinus]|nr:hypothetical protein C2E23DRAFT_744038 [Lenzites betulinus]
MPWQTYFESTSVRYRALKEPRSTANSDDSWKSAGVYISEVTENKRWLMVNTEGVTNPIIWTVIKPGLMITSNEQTITASIKQIEPEVTCEVVHELRFRTHRELWSFVAHITFSRVHASIHTGETELGQATSGTSTQDEPMMSDG